MENPSASRVDRGMKYLSPVTRLPLLLSMLLLSLLVFPASMQAQAVPLGTAANFGVLAYSTVTNTGATVVTGNLGLSPGTSVTGFPPGIVTGTIYTYPSAVAATALADAGTAYTDALAGNATCLSEAAYPSGHNLTGLDLGTISSASGTPGPLPPGVYCMSAAATWSAGTLYLDFSTSTNTFIFQIGTTLITPAGASVVAVGTPSSCNNVIWQVGSSATFGAGITFLGDILANTSISGGTSGTNLVNGSLYALGAAVTFPAANLVTACGPFSPSGPPTGNQSDADVVTGVYRTNINIHNPQNQTVNFCTKVVLPDNATPTGISPLVSWSLGSDHSLFIDCFTPELQSIQSQLTGTSEIPCNSKINKGNVAIYSVKFTCGQQTNIVPPPSQPLAQFEGFVVIEVPQSSQSPALLDVEGKYSARPVGATGAASDVSSLQVVKYRPTLISNHTSSGD